VRQLSRRQSIETSTHPRRVAIVGNRSPLHIEPREAPELFDDMLDFFELTNRRARTVFCNPRTDFVEIAPRSFVDIRGWIAQIADRKPVRHS
jgi:hypothetical protein